jgi:hypothetical protein
VNSNDVSNVKQKSSSKVVGSKYEGVSTDSNWRKILFYFAKMLCLFSAPTFIESATYVVQVCEPIKVGEGMSAHIDYTVKVKVTRFFRLVVCRKQEH